MTEALGSTATPERGRPEDQASQSRRGKRKKKGPLGRMGTFYRQIVAELRKVVWPKRNDLMTYTSVVIVFVVVIIAFVSLLDLGFAKLIENIFA